MLFVINWSYVDDNLGSNAGIMCHHSIFFHLWERLREIRTIMRQATRRSKVA